MGKNTLLLKFLKKKPDPQKSKEMTATCSKAAYEAANLQDLKRINIFFINSHPIARIRHPHANATIICSTILVW